MVGKKSAIFESIPIHENALEKIMKLQVTMKANYTEDHKDTKNCVMLICEYHKQFCVVKI